MTTFSICQGFAAELGQQLHPKKHKKRTQSKTSVAASGGGDSVVAHRMKEIARTALNFSDFEVDEFFSDVETQVSHNS